MATVYFCKIKNTENYSKDILSKAGKEIVKKIVGNSLNKKITDNDFAKGKNGKPYLKPHPDFHFNISHSKSAVAVIFSQDAVGIDIEEIRPVNLKVAEHYFTTAEQDYVNQDKNLSYEHFFEIWTKKEAYIKKNSLKLANLKETKSENIPSFKRDGYIISVCCENIENIEIIDFDIDNLSNL